MTPRQPFRVVVTGSECTGKTTLAQALAERFGAPWAPEYVRGYCDARGGVLTAADVEPIARGQIAEADAAGAAAARAGGLLILDTDLLSTVVYARHYYGSCPAWIEAAARERRGDLYLLLHPDVPWLADAQRDRGDRRDEMHALFQAALAELGARVVPVSGGWEARFRMAAQAVSRASTMEPGAS